MGKQMGDEMKKGAAEAAAAEADSIKMFDALMAAKKKEVLALTKEIETKLERVGTLGVEIAQMKNDLGDTEEALIADKEFLANLDQNCETKKKEWEVVVKTRAEELFKKTLPSAASLMQVQMSTKDSRKKALLLLQKVFKASEKRNPELELIALALKGKKIGFDKVIKMIDDMISPLKVEQADDDAKKEYCATAFDQADDKKKGLERAVSDLETAIENAKEDIAKLGEEIDALKAG